MSDKLTHAVAEPDGKVWCKRCGMVMPETCRTGQLEFVIGAMRAFAKWHRHCDSPAEKVLAWLKGPDTGESSRAIAGEFLGLKIWGRPPSDPEDLGRCLRLIALAPEARAAVGHLSEQYRSWEAAAKVWDELALIYASEFDPSVEKQDMPMTRKAMKEAGL